MFLLRLGIFFAFLTLIYLSQRFWFVGTWHWIGAIQRSNLRSGLQILWCVALLTMLAGFLDPMLGHALSKIAGGKWITAATRIWLVASFFGFFAVKLVGIIGWISGAGATLLSSKQTGFDPARRNFFRYAAYLAGSLPFVAATYGFATGRLKYKVERVDVPIEGLPKALDGMKIAQLNLIGVDYQRDHMTRGPRGPMLQNSEHLVSRDMPNILLSHNPNSFHRAADLGVELSLAGHTHGGQVKVEIVDHSINPARLITDFVAGLYHLPMGNGSSTNGNGKKAFLYVNRGLGTFGK